MEQTPCPACSAPSDRLEIPDTTQFICPHCGGYHLSGTVVEMLENGSRKLPDPASFRDLVRRLRGSSTESPVITKYDLGW